MQKRIQNTSQACFAYIVDMFLVRNSEIFTCGRRIPRVDSVSEDTMEEDMNATHPAEPPKPPEPITETTEPADLPQPNLEWQKWRQHRN